ncbi:hypothetical protein [Achromobacter anxifer]|uniref:hypothetical protein n=1 Tax=Achromobacter anxifer TaxID=1287737 RepID=UPI0023F88E4B|nr:hypothetical protein [Achromobacter anxifer]MDF8363819.1 hypothetical protein [Achromobacter anxifer]
MPSRPADAGIPTLTQRAEPSLHAPSADDSLDAPLLTELAGEAGPAYDDEAFPLLTEVAGPVDTSPTETEAQTAPAAPPDATVLSARLQAEVEQLMREALAEAIDQIQARMDAELPRIVARVLRDVRPG